MSSTYKIALLFNANKPHDRDIIAGISDYLRSTRVEWELFVEDDFLCRPDGIVNLQGDGILADLDDPDVCKALQSARIPVVGIGGSYADESHYPDVPYVASDNARLVEMAYDHLVSSGLPRFAFFSRPPAPESRWAQEREAAFSRLMARDHMSAEIHRGTVPDAQSWMDAAHELAAWLKALPKPVGIIAVNDARARLLLQACASAGIAVPEDVSIIGIDDDPLGRMLARIPLSSVIQGAHTMGRTAAQMLHRLLGGQPLAQRRVVVAPQGVNAQASSLHQVVSHPAVRRGCHYIRQFAFQGIKAEQVADYVGLARSSLDFYFRVHLGRSIHDEILRTRLEQAKRLLHDPARKLADIARCCGFKTAQYLNAVFQREFSCTPMQYRHQAAGTSGPLSPQARRAAPRLAGQPLGARQVHTPSHHYAAHV
jgi:LacI family transcriptional regulator